MLVPHQVIEDVPFDRFWGLGKGVSYRMDIARVADH